MAVPRPVLVAAVCLLQILLVVGAVAPRLSARVLGDEYRFAVAPVDPVDPFRGAYVALSYPGLPRSAPGLDGEVFVPLFHVAQTEVWRGGAPAADRPSGVPYLRCVSRGSGLRCGIESLFASQEEARRLEAELPQGPAAAVVRVDRWGNAAVVTLDVGGRGRAATGG